MKNLNITLKRKRDNLGNVTQTANMAVKVSSILVAWLVVCATLVMVVQPSAVGDIGAILKNACERDGAVLNRKQIVESYARFREIFSDHEDLLQHTVESLKLFEDGLAASKSGGANLQNVLRIHTLRNCGMFASLLELVALKQNQIE